MSRATCFPRLVTCLVLATPLFSAIGCSTFDLNLSDPKVVAQPTSQRLPPADEPEVGGPPTFVMDVRPAGKPAKSAKLPFDPSLTVQDALVKSQVANQFRRMNIELYRELPGGGTHKIDLEFDSKARSVPQQFDYALHPNDRLVVIQDTSTSLDDMLKTVSSNIGL